MRHADRDSEARRRAYRMAERYAREMNAGMMHLYIKCAEEVGGLTPKQKARLEQLLKESRTSAHSTSI